MIAHRRETSRANKQRRPLKIFHTGTLVTSNASFDVIEDAFLAIEGEKIVDLGPWAKRPRSRTAQILEYPEHIATPGLFNLHAHLPMVLFRGVAEDLDLFDWLYKFIFPLEKKWVSPEMVTVGAELALCECIRNGMTFVAEMYFYEEEIARVIDRSGIRAWIGETIWDIPSPDAKTKSEAYEILARLQKKYREHPRIRPAIAAHSPYLCSAETMREAASYARAEDVPVMLHLAETKKEFDDCIAKNGKSPLAFVESTGLLNSPHILLAHSVWLDQADVNTLKKYPTATPVLNVECNAKLASGFPPVTSFRESQIRFALGTDGAASNNNLDLFSEMNFLSKAHHLIEKDLKGLPVTEIFRAATLDAAHAVGLGDKLGSLEVEKSADFILIDRRSAHLSPLTQVYSHLIFSVRGPDVSDVYVAGNCLMKDRKILSLDEPRARKRAENLWKKMRNSVS